MTASPSQTPSSYEPPEGNAAWYPCVCGAEHPKEQRHLFAPPEHAPTTKSIWKDSDV